MNRSWSSRHRHSSEYRLIMTTAFGLCAGGAARSVVPGLDTAVGAVRIAAVLVTVGAAVVRRELRIRRRVADLDGLRYWPRPPGGAPETQVGPGEHAPVLPAPTDRPFHAVWRCRMTTPADPARPGPPTVREIAALTARLRDISARGRDVDETERAAFLADKDALIARITDTTSTADTRGRVGLAVQDATTEVAHARAVDPGYVLVGPSARTWLRDPATGQPASPVSEAEHRAVRELMGREALDTTEPQWVVGDDGHTDIHTTVVPAAAPEDAPDDAGWPVTLTRAEAATRLTELGHDQASAQAMVADYLHETSRAVGAPVYQWGLDQNDIDAIAADYRWVDHERGETLAQARERAAEHATGRAAHASTADRETSPGYASHAEGQAAQWAARASTPEPFTHPDPDDDVDSDAGSDDPWLGRGETSTAAELEGLEYPRTGVVQAKGSEEWHRATGADLDRAGRGPLGIPEQDRREQLARWHAEDLATQDDTAGAEWLGGEPFDLSRGDHR